MSKPGTDDRDASGRLDFVCCAILAAVGLVLFFWFIPTFAPGEGGPGQIAPSFFPRLAVAVVFACAVLVMAGSARSLLAPGNGAGQHLLAELFGWAAFALALFALLHWAGFVPAGIFAVLCGVALARYRRRPVLIATLAIGLPLLLDWSVWELFWIELP